MLNKLINKKGEAMIGFAISAGIIVSLLGIMHHLDSEEFKQNKKIIWCKMKGNTNCGN